MEQPRQRAAAQLTLRLHFKKDYFYKLPQGTGADITYNLKRASRQPELLGQYMHDNQIHIKYDSIQDTIQNWAIWKYDATATPSSISHKQRK